MLPGGWLLYEIGWDQGKAVKELLDKEGFINTEIKKDLCWIRPRSPGTEIITGGTECLIN